MPEGGFVNLQPKIESSGGLTFCKAEWWSDDPRFVVVTYSYKNSEKWVRMDLDKQRLIDQQDDTHLDDLINETNLPYMESNNRRTRIIALNVALDT